MMTERKKLIWDLPIRIFHAALIFLLPAAWYTVEISEDMDQHFIIGYCILSLVTFRIIWGFIGSRYARFYGFIPTPRKLVTYITSLKGRQETSLVTAPENYAGHNPLGALSVVALLLLLSIQVSTGLFSNDEYYYFGPLSEKINNSLSNTLTESHKINFNVLVSFVALHIGAVVFYWLIKKQNLILPMITGRKTDNNNQLTAITGSKSVLSLIVICVCAAASYWLSTLGSGV